MAPSNPRQLVPYLSPPQYSLSILTSVLGASTNWLVLRHLLAAFASPQPDDGEGLPQSNTKVVFVSFMKPWDFWKAEARKLGLDFERLEAEHRLRFVDGVSELFSDGESYVYPQASKPPRALGAFPPQTGNIRTPNMQWVENDGLAQLELDIVNAVNQLKTHSNETQDGSQERDGDVLLIIDQPDFLLSATGPDNGVGPTVMVTWILGLRGHVHSTIVTLSADYPLVHNSTGEPLRSSPLEQAHLAFLTSMSHQATLIMQLRLLDTGIAIDISGVIRISQGGGVVLSSLLAPDGPVENYEVEENEFLYFVQPDAGVQVFGRGE